MPAGSNQFEETILRHTSCDVHTLGCGHRGPTIRSSRHHHHKWCIGSGSSSIHRSWANVTQSLGHTRVDLLNIVEGASVTLYQQLQRMLADSIWQPAKRAYRHSSGTGQQWHWTALLTRCLGPLTRACSGLFARTAGLPACLPACLHPANN